MSSVCYDSQYTPHGSVMHVAVILWKQISEVAIVFVLDLQILGGNDMSLKNSPYGLSILLH
jgi:hypothetical protein